MQKVKRMLTKYALGVFAGLAITTGGVMLVSSPVWAGEPAPTDTQQQAAPNPVTVDCAILDCTGADSATGDGIFNMLTWVLNILTGVVGIAAVGGVIWAGMLYMSAGDKTDQVKKAKTIIVDVVIGVLAYALMYVFLNWIIPGGVFN